MNILPHLSAIRKRLFATPLDIVITLVIAYLLWRAIVPLVEWIFVDATFSGTTRNDCTSGGACWVFVRARFGQFMYGLYPPTERWRVELAGAILVIAVALLIGFVALPGAFLARALVERLPIHIHTAMLDAVVMIGGAAMMFDALRR